MRDKDEELIEYALAGTFVRFFPYGACILLIIIVGLLLDNSNRVLMDCIMGVLLVLPFFYSFIRPLLLRREINKDELIKTYKQIKEKSDKEKRIYYKFILFNLEYELNDCLKIDTKTL